MPWYRALGYTFVVIQAFFGFRNLISFFRICKRNPTPEEHLDMAWVVACSALLLAIAALVLAWLK